MIAGYGRRKNAATSTSGRERKRKNGAADKMG
jgi:hypothetical protein